MHGAVRSADGRIHRHRRAQRQGCARRGLAGGHLPARHHPDDRRGLPVRHPRHADRHGLRPRQRPGPRGRLHRLVDRRRTRALRRARRGSEGVPPACGRGPPRRGALPPRPARPPSAALDAAVKAYRQHAAGRLAVAFTPTIATAHALAEKLRAGGVPAEAVSGKTPTDERRAILARLHRGETRVVANAQVLIEGWDEPAVSCALMLRPTKSAPAFCLDAKTEILTDQGWKGIADDL